MGYFVCAINEQSPQFGGTIATAMVMDFVVLAP
jgi:hypothetical protein